MDHVIAEHGKHGVSERFACRALGQHRSTPTTPDDEAALTADIIALATQYGRYGYPIMPLELASSIGETAMAIFQPACCF